MRWSSSVCALVLVFACGGEPAPTPIESEPEAESTEPSATETSDEPPVEPETERTPENDAVEPLPLEPSATYDVPAPPGPLRVLDLSRAGRIHIDSLDTTMRTASTDTPYDLEARVPVVRHPVAAVATELNRVLEEAAFQLVRDADVHNRGCRVTLAHERLVSVNCAGKTNPERDWVNAFSGEYSFAIADGVVTPTRSRAGLVPGTNLDPRVRRACEAEHNARSCAEALGYATLNVAANGMLVSLGVSDTYFETLVPWRELDRRILADSPIGAVVQTFPRVSVVEIEPPRVGSSRLDARSGLSVARPGRLNDALLAWLAEPAPRREGLLLTRVAGGQYATVFPFGSSPTAEAEARERFGPHLDVLQWQAALEPLMVRTRTPATLRYRPRARFEMALPAGTILGAVRGQMHDYQAVVESSIREPGSWAWVGLNTRSHGWVSGNLVREYSGCVPATSGIIADLDDEQRRLALSTLLRGTLRLGADPVAFFAYTTEPAEGGAGGRTRVALHELSAACEVGDERASMIVNGPLRALGFPRVAPGAEERLAVVAAVTRHPTGPHVSVSVRRLDLGRPLATERFFDTRPELHTSVGRGDDYRLIAVQSHHPSTPSISMRWDGEAVVVERPDEP